MDKQSSQRTWSRRLRETGDELSRSPHSRACGGALLASGLFACAGARRGRALALGACVGVLHREILAGLLRVEREARNSTDATTVAAWLGEATPPLGTWAIEADFGRLVAEAVRNRPRVVVECGSGVTTLLIASALRSNGVGKLYSLEHDSTFAEETRCRLETAGLSEWVDLIQAPLREQMFDDVTVRWYDIEVVMPAIPSEIDLLIVDGPPALQEWARWPALETFDNSLSDGATILLDDGRRATERHTAMRWDAFRTDMTLYWVDTIKGTWMLRKTPPAATYGASGGAIMMRHLRRCLNPMPAGFGRWPVQR